MKKLNNVNLYISGYSHKIIYQCIFFVFFTPIQGQTGKKLPRFLPDVEVNKKEIKEAAKSDFGNKQIARDH